MSTVFIDPIAQAKIMHWVEKAKNKEVSGFGKVICTNGCALVTEVYLLEQENTGASTDIDAKSLAKLMFETKDVPGHLNYWWHSHSDMAAFFSGTDTDTIQQLGSQGWIIASVFNRKGESKHAVLLTHPFQIYLDTLTLQPWYGVDKTLREEWDKEFTAKVKEWSYKATGYWNEHTKKWIEYGKKDEEKLSKKERRLKRIQWADRIREEKATKQIGTGVPDSGSKDRSVTESNSTKPNNGTDTSDGDSLLDHWSSYFN